MLEEWDRECEKKKINRHADFVLEQIETNVSYDAIRRYLVLNRNVFEELSFEQLAMMFEAIRFTDYANSLVQMIDFFRLLISFGWDCNRVFHYHCDKGSGTPLEVSLEYWNHTTIRALLDPRVGANVNGSVEFGTLETFLIGHSAGSCDVNCIDRSVHRVPSSFST